MCGICGLHGQLARDALESSIGRMVRSIAHRGPDREATYVAEGIALGHRRLSIIDLSPAGAQPMTVGSATLVYNGESYNFRELRRSLQSLGHEFRGHSDTEVVLHAYEEWGLQGLTKLEGMFALALWDERRRRLILMRDRLGIKPLFYAHANEGLVFGSEIKSLLASGSIARDVDAQSFAEYLWYGNTFEDRTIYRDVRALEPGHWMIVEDGHARVEPWWRIEEWLTVAPPSTEPREAAVHVREVVDAAVKRQLVSDVPVGIFLSGGIDSSTIAASAAAAGARLLSYAVGFDFDRGVNELPKARKVASALNFEHHELHVAGTQLTDVIERLVTAHDEPFADAANIPLYLLAQALGGSVKVVLQGDGGDEMFAGYRRYSTLSRAALWRFWPQWSNGVLRRFGGAHGARSARFAAAAGSRDAALRMALLLTVEALADPPTTMLSESAREHLASGTDPFMAYRRCASRFASYEPVQRMLLTDTTLQLPSQFLPKVDRSTMACSLESRVPLLDEKVASLAVSLPSNLKVRGAQRKIVLREAARGRLPQEILDGPKTGFGVPFEYWLRGPLYSFARDAVLDSSFVQHFGFNHEQLERAFDEHREGRRNRGFLLWKLMQLSLWSRRYLQ